MQPAKAVITSAEWSDKLNEVKLRKDDMNRLIMNFLVTEVSLALTHRFSLITRINTLQNLSSPKNNFKLNTICFFLFPRVM